MPILKGSDAIEQAFFDTWREYDVLPDDVQKKRIRAFKKRWQGLDITAFKNALQEGDGTDKLFALFALGYIAPTGIVDLLLPFLSSPIQKERWASAIVLGQRKDERVFALLGQLLTEQMELLPSDHDEYAWYMGHRITITSILRDWNDPRAIPMLRQALEKCVVLECPTSMQNGPSIYILESLYELEDELAYALGTLEAWNSLEGLKFPAPRLKLARLYLVFGSLHLNISSLEDDHIMLLLLTGTLDRQQIANVLQERFGVDSYTAKASVEQFKHWYRQRIEAHRQRFE